MNAMNRKNLALAAALMLAAACGADKKTAEKTAAPKPAAELPADVAHLAKPDPQATPAPTAPATAETSAAPAPASLAALAPTGEFVSPAKSEVAPKEPGRVAATYREIAGSVAPINRVGGRRQIAAKTARSRMLGMPCPTPAT